MLGERGEIQAKGRKRSVLLENWWKRKATAAALTIFHNGRLYCVVVGL